MKKLSELYDIDSDILVSGISINSKEVKNGDIFVCVSGVNFDRHLFVDEAINNGCCCIVASRDIGKRCVPVIYVDNTDTELTKLAKKLYDYKDGNLGLFGVTGTNGKTSVTSIIQDMLGDDVCGYMGTNGIKCSKFNQKIRNTTPDADRLYMYFDKFVKSGCKYLSMEASSEAFFRKRLVGVTFDVGIITNITEDHLNIHKTIENYVDCKLELLKNVKDSGLCILNTEDKYFEKEFSSCCSRVVTYGKKMDATLRLIDYKYDNTFMKIMVSYKDKIYSFKSPLIGEFNVYNLMAAMLLLLEYLNISIEDVIKSIQNIQTIPGRLQLLDYNQDYKIILDYAHTPDAFLNLYPSLNSIKNKRLITVTGSAGGREASKRGPMGKIVLENSDYVIFTMDDPRCEDVDKIIDDLVSCTNLNNYERIIDRKTAIFKALSIAREDDIVLIAGKGVDDYMAVGNKYLKYCDLDVIEEYFK